MPDIEARINKKTGELTLEAFGYQGNGCAADLDQIISLMGGMTVDARPKDENVINVAIQKLGRG